MNPKEVINLLKKRRSVRKYTDQKVREEDIISILEAGQWAPSGLNNQPWRFVVIQDGEIKKKVAPLTKYSRIIEEAPVCIAVFLHLPSGYNRDKDILSIGASIQNMLIAIDALGLGAVWLGEILNNKEKVNSILKINTDYELMAVIALGHPDEHPKKERKELSSLIVKRI